MEKWRIFTLLGGLGLGVLAALLGWWLFSPIENESYFWQILRFLALIVAYFLLFSPYSCFFILFSWEWRITMVAKVSEINLFFFSYCFAFPCYI